MPGGTFYSALLLTPLLCQLDNTGPQLFPEPQFCNFGTTGRSLQYGPHITHLYQFLFVKLRLLWNSQPSVWHILIKVSCFGKLKSYILPAKKISQQGQYLRKKKLFGQATWSPLRSTPRKIKCYQDFFFFYFWPWTHSGSKWLKSAKNVFTWFKTNQQNYSISVCSDCMLFVI